MGSRKRRGCGAGRHALRGGDARSYSDLPARASALHDERSLSRVVFGHAWAAGGQWAPVAHLRNERPRRPHPPVVRGRCAAPRTRRTSVRTGRRRGRFQSGGSDPPQSPSPRSSSTPQSPSGATGGESWHQARPRSIEATTIRGARWAAGECWYMRSRSSDLSQDFVIGQNFRVIARVPPRRLNDDGRSRWQHGAHRWPS